MLSVTLRQSSIVYSPCVLIHSETKLNSGSVKWAKLVENANVSINTLVLMQY